MSCGYLPAALCGAWEKCRWHNFSQSTLVFAFDYHTKFINQKNKSKIKILQVVYELVQCKFIFI
jgi:hypothetical protein